MAISSTCLSCKAVDNKNYALGLSETLMQLKVLPEKLAYSLVWNRFCKTRGKANSNMPIHLFMEHENKCFKQQLATHIQLNTPKQQ